MKSPDARLPFFCSLALSGLIAVSTVSFYTPNAHAGTKIIRKEELNEDKTIRLEKVVATARKAHPDMRIINTFEEVVNGKKVDKVFYILPNTKDTKIITIDSLTGKIREDRAYKLPEKQKSIPLETLLSSLRKKHSITKIIRTRLAQRDGRDVRIIIYVDKLKQQRLMVVDTKTGEVISDKARKLS